MFVCPCLGAPIVPVPASRTMRSDVSLSKVVEDLMGFTRRIALNEIAQAPADHQDGCIEK